MNDVTLILSAVEQGDLVIVQTAMTAGMVQEDVFNAALAASLISIFLNVFAVRSVLGWIDRRWPNERAGAH